MAQACRVYQCFPLGDKLEAYPTEFSNDLNGSLVHVDVGGWQGAKPDSDRHIDEILTDARPAVYFRNDYVDVELKKLSVREILPLP